MEMALETVYADDIVLYMTQHSTNEEYVGTIEITPANDCAVGLLNTVV